MTTSNAATGCNVEHLPLRVCIGALHFIGGHNGQRTFARDEPVDLHPPAVKPSPVLEISALIVAEQPATKQTFHTAAMRVGMSAW